MRIFKYIKDWRQNRKSPVAFHLKLNLPSVQKLKTSSYKGHPITKEGDHWVYVDNGLKASEHYKQRGCGFCNKPDTQAGHDACLGTLEHPDGIVNACCGHGDSEAYIQFSNNICIRGDAAIRMFEKLKEQKPRLET